jgi:hypothetical protein
MVIQPRSLACQPTQVETLLDSFIPSRRYVPDNARRVNCRDELPLRLQRRAGRVRQGIWRAWTDGFRVWFVVARLMPIVGREANHYALRVSFFDMDGRLASCAVWTLSSDGRWTLYDPHPQP